MQKLFDKGNSVLFRWNNDASWSTDYVSKNVSNLLGYSAEEFLENKISYSDCIHPDFIAQVQEEVLLASQNKSDFFEHKPYKIITKTKQEKWVKDQTLREEDGDVVFFVGYIIDITKSIELAHENDALHKRVQLAVEHTNDGIWDWDLKNNEVFFSSQWKKMLGYKEDEIVDTPEMFFGLIHPEDREKTQNAVSDHLKHTTDFYSAQLRLLCKDGTYKWILSRGKALFDEQNNPLRMIGSHVDISYQKEIERQLQQAQKMAKMGLWELYHTDGRLEWSDEVFHIFEIDKEKFAPSYEAFLQRTHPSDRKTINNAFINSLETKLPYELTHRLLLPNGHIKYLLEQCSTEFAKDGSPLISRGTVQDITDFTILDQAMIKERTRLKAFMNNSSDGILILDEKLKLVEYSNVMKKMLGYDDNEMNMLYITDIDVLLNKQEIEYLIAKLSLKPTTFETVQKRKDGTTFNASVTATFMKIEDKKYTYASIRDISEIKKLQEEILREKHFIETIIESANAVIAIIDRDGTMVKLNRYGEKFTGYTQEEISQEPYKWKSLLPQNIRENVVQIITKAKEGKLVKSYQNEWISKSGEQRMFEWSNNLINKEDGSMDYISTIGIDITQNEKQKMFLQLLINSQSNMMALADNDELLYVNQAVLDFYDLHTLEEMKAKHICFCNTFIKTDYSFYIGKVQKSEEWISKIQLLPPEKQIVSILSIKSQKLKTFKVNIETYLDSNTYLITFVDISETIQKQQELEYKSNHDPLTKAYNRAYFYEEYQKNISQYLQQDSILAIALIDIDHFKNVNDTYGHDIGDEILKILVTTIWKNTRESDTLIRWGGEEFILLMPIKNQESLHKKLDALRLSIENTAMPHVGNITVSIGACVYDTTTDIEESIKTADDNLYNSKNNGRNRVTIF